MKSKKNIIITCALAVLCICVLIGVYFLTRSPETKFIPSASENTETHDEQWTELTDSLPANSSLKTNDNTETEVRQGTEKDSTQAVIRDKNNEVVTDLSGSKPKEDISEEKPVSPPVSAENTANPDQQPSYNETVPTAPESDSSTTDSGHEGQVYDPVFGWIDAGTAQGQVIDNDGSIDKQVGTMD